MQVFFSRLFILLLTCTGLSLPAQNVKIKGQAHPSHAGKPINLFLYSDLITYTQTREASDTIDKNGYFELDLQIDHTQPAELQIENLTGKLYIQPDFVYGITYPERDSSIDRRGDVSVPVQLGVISADTTELNTMIIDFNRLYNKVFSNLGTEFLNRNRLHKKIDSLEFLCKLRYFKNKNRYFTSYLDYTLADINSNATRGKNFMTSRYILDKPVQHQHYEYMAFFNTFFKGYLNAYSSTIPGENIYHIINTTGSYKVLNVFLKNDPLLKNDTLREMVIIRNLWDYYFSPQFDNHQVVDIIEQFRQETKIDVHKKIAENILTIVNKLQPGSKAPEFSAIDRAGKEVSLSDFKNKYVYLNFFSTQSLNSLNEMPKVMDLVKKYGDKVSFISICTDDSIKTYKEYIKANPKYTWTILYNGTAYSSAKKVYNIKGVPACFFINNYGTLMQSPAQTPTQGFEFKLKALFKPKRSGNKIGIR